MKNPIESSSHRPGSNLCNFEQSADVNWKHCKPEEPTKSEKCFWCCLVVPSLMQGSMSFIFEKESKINRTLASFSNGLMVQVEKTRIPTKKIVQLNRFESVPFGFNNSMAI